MKLKASKVPSLLATHYKSKTPLLLIGPAGLGKTSMVKQFGAERGVNVYEYRAAYCEPGDLKGLCAQDGDAMKFLRPEDFPPESDENCILFFDEINRASTAVMNCILQATDGSGKISTHKLPKGCLVIAAVNPDDASHNVNLMDFALANRFNIVQLDYDSSVLIDYARKSNWNRKVIGFMQAEKGLFSGERHYNGASNMPTPRSLERLSDLENAGIDDSDVHRAIACGLLGDAIGLQYFAYATGEQPVSVIELFDDSEAALKRVKKLSDPKGLRSDLLSATSSEIVRLFTERDSIAKGEHKAIVEYFATIPADLAAAALKAICNAKPEYVDIFQSETKLMKRLGERLKNVA